MFKAALLALVAAAAVLFCGCNTQPPLPSFGVVPDFTLTDQTGAPFASKEKLDRHVWIADFIFTTCQGPCPRMSSQMRQLGDSLKDQPQVQLVSFTVDPDRDTPEALAAYAKNFAADPSRWHFLTGSRTDLQKLSFNAFRLNDTGGQLEHSTRFALVDGRSRIRGYYDTADQESMRKLPEDVRSLVRRSRD